MEEIIEFKNIKKGIWGESCHGELQSHNKKKVSLSQL